MVCKVTVGKHLATVYRSHALSHVALLIENVSWKAWISGNFVAGTRCGHRIDAMLDSVASDPEG